jgi:dihydrofolate synthase/folylpolyglutamate synthase
MDYQEAVDFLDAHIGLGVQPGLGRIRGLLEFMGDPQFAYPVIHVTGSNGKTSTSRMATSLLVAHGLRVGTFTSPHLEVIEERLALDGECATAGQFAGAVADLVPFVRIFEEQTGDSLTYFELTAALAFTYFAANAVDVAVVEVGLGGRLDATNAVDGRVAVVTGISLEHTSWLGNSIEEIAGEKLAIAKESSVLVTGPLPEAAQPLAGARADELGISHRRFGAEFHPEFVRMAVGGWTGSISGVYESYEDIHLPLHGRYQFNNLAVAVAAVEELTGRPLDPAAVREGAAAVTSPGRLEVVGHHPLVLLDGAHNAQACGLLSEAIATEFLPADWVVVIGAMGDKNIEAMFDQLSQVAGSVVATAVDYERAIPAETLAEVAGSTLEVPVHIAPDVPTALDAARRLAGEEGSILVTGSLYVVGEARGALRGSSAESGESSSS